MYNYGIFTRTLKPVQRWLIDPAQPDRAERPPRCFPRVAIEGSYHVTGPRPKHSRLRGRPGTYRTRRTDQLPQLPARGAPFCRPRERGIGLRVLFLRSGLLCALVRAVASQMKRRGAWMNLRPSSMQPDHIAVAQTRLDGPHEWILCACSSRVLPFLLVKPRPLTRPSDFAAAAPFPCRQPRLGDRRTTRLSVRLPPVPLPRRHELHRCLHEAPQSRVRDPVDQAPRGESSAVIRQRAAHSTERRTSWLAS